MANDATWNCEQNKESKEWSCVGEKKHVKNAPKKEHPSSVESASTIESNQSTATSGNTSVEAEPKQTVQASPPEPADLQQPVVIKLDEGDKPLPSVSQKPAPNQAQASETSRPSGWTCKANEQNKDWNCNLVGADPKGEARIIQLAENKFSVLDPAFDYNQEQVFNTLSSQLKYDPWANCTVAISPRPNYVAGRNARDSSPLDVKSDYSEVFENELSSYSGNVEITRSDQHSLSHSATYDSVSQTMDLHGDVYYSEDELALYSNSATLKLASDQANLRDVMFIAPTTPIRGHAKTIYRDNKYLSRYEDVSYTSCPPNNQDWVVHASDLKLNDATGKGAAKNAWVEFKSLPVFYSPYLSFPIDDRRLSGFLAPNFGSTQRSGFNFSVPYYWNIAPNYDATLRPRYLTKRGVLLAGDFRLLTKYSNGIASLEYMPDDELRNKSRFLGKIKNSSHFTSKIHSNLDLNYVSDKQYFSELGNALSFPNFSYVRSTADVSYINEGVSFVSRLENYQTIDNTLIGLRRPYRRLPQVNLNLDHAFDVAPINTAFNSEYVYFQHDSIVNAQRFNVKPSVSFPLKAEAAFLTPKLSVQYTDYQLSRQNDNVYQLSDPTMVSPFPDSISRTLPIVSLDSGLFLEKELAFAQSPLKHTLEPRLFYLYIPRKDQHNIPLFDSSRYDFWYQSLFRENRFSGSDRIQDANQLTAALTSRLVDPNTGRERLKLDIGEIIYFQNREVTAPLKILNLPTGIDLSSTNGYLESPAETSTLSPLIAELSSDFSDHWSVETGLQWDPYTNDIVRGKAILHFADQSKKIFNVGFLYRKNPFIKDTIEHNLEFLSSPEINHGVNPLSLLSNERIIRSNDITQSDVSFRWPLFANWFAVGRWQYSWLYNKTQETFLGLEKETCCWRFQIIGRRYVNNTNITNVNSTANTSQFADATSQTGIFFQFELKGLTGIGQKLDKFFVQSIYGYRKPEK